MKRIMVIAIIGFTLGFVIGAYQAVQAAGPGDTGTEVTEVQMRLKAFGYTVTVDGKYGPQTTKAVKSWQKSNGLSVDGVAGPVTLASLRGAVRQNNATQVTGLNGLAFAPAGLDNCAEMKFYRQQAGLPDVFDSLGWRESNCRNEDSVKTFCCHGYWQLHQNHVRSGYATRLRQDCDIDSYQDFNSDVPLDKQRQACGAKVLYDMSGMSPWR